MITRTAHGDCLLKVENSLKKNFEKFLTGGAIVINFGLSMYEIQPIILIFIYTNCIINVSLQ